MKIGIISGASSGIGRAIAKNLKASDLDELWLIGRNGDKLNSLINELNCNTRCFQLDLTDGDSITILNDAIVSTGAEVKYLILSAGVGFTGTVESNTQNQISQMVDLNCKSLSLLINAVLPHMIRGGEIITIASGAGFLPQADFAVYAATKAYVISLSRALRKELKPKKINVCTVCPGPVDTDFFSGLDNVKDYKRKYLISPNRVAIGAIKASKRGKAIFTPTFSMKLLRICTKLLPTSFIQKMSK